MANVRRERKPETAAHLAPAAPVVTRTAGLTGRTALEALGTVPKGGHLFVLSKGAVSAGDVITWALEQTGDADVFVSTWTISPEEIRGLKRLVDSGRIRTFRLLTDFSFGNRHPAYAALLRSTFGPGAVALTVCHAKLATVVNDSWAVVIRSSANLNRNSRTEYHEVSDDRGLADFITETLSGWFPARPDTWAIPVAEHRRRFDLWGEDLAAARLATAEHGGDRKSESIKSQICDLKRDEVAKALGISKGAIDRAKLKPVTVEDAGFFEDGPYGRDLRRVGLTYAKG
jgi:hypothetical protein